MRSARCRSSSPCRPRRCSAPFSLATAAALDPPDATTVPTPAPRRRLRSNPFPRHQVLLQIPTAAFSGSAQARDKLVLQLLQRGKDANTKSDFAAAAAAFEAAYALSVRSGMLVSAANMRLKLGHLDTCEAM